jgi:SSS family solute:Na+ symporter
MAQNFWTAIYAFGVCFLVTVAVSLATRPRAEQELKGLVYSLTPRLRAAGERWYARPAVLGAFVLAGAVVLNFIFR